MPYAVCQLYHPLDVMNNYSNNAKAKRRTDGYVKLMSTFSNYVLGREGNLMQYPTTYENFVSFYSSWDVFSCRFRYFFVSVHVPPLSDTSVKRMHLN